MEETALPAYFGEWLKSRRRELDLTQAELARRAGCSLPALRKIEAGERRPSKQLAGLLAKSLEIPSEDHTTFIKVARGELNLDRLRFPGSVGVRDHAVGQTPSHPKIKLPFQATTLIGREPELVALEKLLVDPHCRLLTITGMGGIGKTRLAIEFAYMKQALFPGGVYFVPLASLDSANFIVPTIAEVLNITLAGTLDPKEQLLNHLEDNARQATLLILDDLEHLLIPTAQEDGKTDVTMLFMDLLQRIPNLKILITSREQVYAQGEWTFDLQGLSFPSSDQPGFLENYSAPALFTQRARRVKADFEVLPDEQSFLVRLCQMVEGAPLAIELAAAWVGVLSVEEITKEIAANLDFLTTSLRDVSERHRSLRAAFEHSWNLLSLEEQQGLAQLAVFRGGFLREAAEQVAGTSLPVLMSLFSKSLLLRRENGRYDLHEVVRQNALSHLKQDRHYDATLDRHCKYYLTFVQGQEEALKGSAQFMAIQVLGKELDNLRAAMSWSLAQKKYEWVIGIATGLGQFWLTQGYWHEGLDWLERSLEDKETLPDEVRAKALTLGGWLSRYQGDYPRAIALLQKSLGLWRQIGDRNGLTLTLCNLGASVLRLGDMPTATEMLEEALSLSKQEGDRFGIYFSLEILGHAASRQGNSQRSIELYNQALILARQANDENQISKLMASTGYEYIILSDYDRAEDLFRQAEPICQKLNNRMVSTFITANRGIIAMKRGNYPRAFDLLADSILALQELGDKEEAISCFEPMAFIVQEMNYPYRAAQLLAASESLRKSMGVIRSQPIQADYEMYIVEVSNQLGETAFTKAWEQGYIMTYEQAVAYAVALGDSQNFPTTRSNPPRSFQ